MAHLSDPVADLEQLHVAGFYISCATDLQNRFYWITESDQAQRLDREIIHYFNLLLAREVVLTLSNLSNVPEHKEFWGLDTSQERDLREFVLGQLDTDPLFHLQGVSPLRQTLEAIEREMFRCHTQMLRGLSISSTLPATFLGDLTTLLCRIMPRFNKKKIAFLIDDYSTHRLHEPVQRVPEPRHMGTPAPPISSNSPRKSTVQSSPILSEPLQNCPVKWSRSTAAENTWHWMIPHGLNPGVPSP